ncbi:NmrA family NAD(P)-binding protein [Coprobacter sp.]
MILITDITNCLGNDLLFALDEKENMGPIRVISDGKQYTLPDCRRLKPEIFTASLFDMPSLDKAFKDADQLVICNSNFLQDYRPAYTNLVRCAQEAGVGHIIFVSTLFRSGASSRMVREDREIENLIKYSGIPYTILRTNMLMEYLPFFIGTTVENEHIYYPGGNGRVGFVSSKDVAKVISELLMENKPANKVYTLTHEISYSFEDIADKLSRQTGCKIIYEPIALDIYEEALLDMNLPIYVVKRLSSVAVAITRNEFDQTGYTLQKMLNKENSLPKLKSGIKSWFFRKEPEPLEWSRSLTSLSDYLRQTYSA